MNNIEFTSANLIGECISKKEVADYISELVERGCDFALVNCGGYYNLYAKGNLPEWAND